MASRYLYIATTMFSRGSIQTNGMGEGGAGGGRDLSDVPPRGFQTSCIMVQTCHAQTALTNEQVWPAAKYGSHDTDFFVISCVRPLLVRGRALIIAHIELQLSIVHQTLQGKRSKWQNQPTNINTAVGLQLYR